MIPYSKRLIVHIGPHKTGSTAIQKYFFKHYSGLLENGVLYPHAGRHPDFPNQHWLLGHAVCTNDASYLKKFAADLATEIEAANPETVILSTEALARKTAGRSQYAMIAELFPNAQIEWAVLLRNPSSLVKSLYSEHVRRGLLSYPQVMSSLAHPEYIGQLGRLCNLAEAAACGRVRLASFDEIKGNLVENFLEMLGLRNCFDPNWRDVSAHEALPMNAAEWFRFVNVMPERLARPVRARMTRWIWKYGHYLPKLQSSTKGMQAALGPFYAECRAIELLFFGGRDSGLLGPGPGNLIDFAEPAGADEHVSQLVSDHAWLQSKADPFHLS